MFTVVGEKYEEGWMNGWMNEWMDGWACSWMNEWIGEHAPEWMNGWMDGWMEGRRNIMEAIISMISGGCWIETKKEEFDARLSDWNDCRLWKGPIIIVTFSSSPPSPFSSPPPPPPPSPSSSSSSPSPPSSGDHGWGWKRLISLQSSGKFLNSYERKNKTESPFHFIPLHSTSFHLSFHSFLFPPSLHLETHFTPTYFFVSFLFLFLFFIFECIYFLLHLPQTPESSQEGR